MRLIVHRHVRVLDVAGASRGAVRRACCAAPRACCVSVDASVWRRSLVLIAVELSVRVGGRLRTREITAETKQKTATKLV